MIAKLIENMGIDITSFSKEAEKLVAYKPKVSGGKLFTSQDFTKALMQAEKEAKNMRD